MAARAFNRTYLVPPITLAAAAAGAATATSLAMEDRVEVRKEGWGIDLRLLRVRHLQEAGVVAVHIPVLEDQAAPASSSSATRRKPPPRRQ